MNLKFNNNIIFFKMVYIPEKNDLLIKYLKLFIYFSINNNI